MLPISSATAARTLERAFVSAEKSLTDSRDFGGVALRDLSMARPPCAPPRIVADDAQDGVAKAPGMDAMEILTSSLFIGEGAERAVYCHPQNSHLCIKVRRPGCAKPEETIGEIRFWRALEARGCDFQYLPRFHGWRPTNLGEGAVWDRVRSHDGATARSAEACLAAGEIDPYKCREKLLWFHRWALDNEVITRDLHLRNFVCSFQSRHEYRLMLVDGWGNSEFIPVSSWSSALARGKIERRWKRFIAAFDAEVAATALPEPRRRAA